MSIISSNNITNNSKPPEQIVKIAVVTKIKPKSQNYQNEDLRGEETVKQLLELVINETTNKEKNI